jgi:hypothetical protein
MKHLSGEVRPRFPVSPVADMAAIQYACGVLKMTKLEDRWLSITEIFPPRKSLGQAFGDARP